MQEIKIGVNDAGQRLDRFLQKHYATLTKSMMYKAIRNKKIKVNRKRCTYDQKLQEGDSILLFLPYEFLETRQKACPVNTGSVDVVYEDDDIVLVNKPAGLLSQSDEKGLQDTLVNRIQYYLYQKKEYDPQRENSFAPAICHRLDKNTSGLILAAKNARALRLMNDAIACHKVRKVYYAKIEGTPLWDTREVVCYIKKQETRALVQSNEAPGYKEARMFVKVMERQKEQTMVQIHLETGRFHQIRASMAYLGYPLCGDVKYGYKGSEKKYSLCAYHLEIGDVSLPIANKDFTVPIPF
ncbi:RluA family pseudouridine synthase [Faecalicoccus pleomorphus]|uniref:RluA family pseudouridine synthase n=1 Tax=Faecalicoccus pleomorphus TaxID=1323 RepID=UPI001960CD1E|nr:RluA family pseudouridine synthase [Faecalicoccus pleomorphus]MBM6764462.1 RluA family pseudouridine synthase [Faecalicoccus pleomorphus]MDM8292316.1 RluA family pseudouridine synthase [Faecalicoccus pleomorphus]